ncbi:MAG: hypothetical protein HY021_08610 [Burkholderiales bacterium]|nr:hypothetical protein [Burkholderiales bacterium]
MMNKRLLVPVLAPAMLSSLLLVGCGGGSSSDNVPAKQAQTSSPSVTLATVRLEGCVVNSQWMGAPDIAVHLRTADGRVVGTAFTNRKGVFVVTVPAQSSIVLDTAASGPGELALFTGNQSLSVGACLLVDL